MNASAEPARELPPRLRVIALVAWCSFLVASVATMICFAYVDPQSALAGGMAPSWWSRRAVYAAGFFGFWLACAGASALTLYMVRQPEQSSGGHS
jgi:TRAP-type C4-dicarboxylate transport system permease small subunit